MFKEEKTLLLSDFKQDTLHNDDGSYFTSDSLLTLPVQMPISFNSSASQKWLKAACASCREVLVIQQSNALGSRLGLIIYNTVLPSQLSRNLLTKLYN